MEKYRDEVISQLRGCLLSVKGQCDLRQISRKCVLHLVVKLKIQVMVIIIYANEWDTNFWKLVISRGGAGGPSMHFIGCS